LDFVVGHLEEGTQHGCLKGGTTSYTLKRV
jgi:hypothetical protein